MTPILNLHDIDVTKFLAVLDTCEGNVYLVTSEGDRLNLKSKLCQLVGLTKLIEGGRIAEASIICDNKNDESKLFRFNFFGDTADANLAAIRTVSETQNGNLVAGAAGFQMRRRAANPIPSEVKRTPKAGEMF